MILSLQLVFPSSSGTFFDYDYCFGSHQKVLEKYMGQNIQSVVVTKGKPGPSGQTAPFYAIATLTFTDKTSFDAAMGAAGPVMADFANFTDAIPITLFGEVAITA